MATKVVREREDEKKVVLIEGDTISLGLQGEARVDGMKVWLKADYTSTVQPGESATQALARIEHTAQQLFTQHTMASVETITHMGD